MVHQYQLNGYNIVLDTCSGSVHVVDEVAYDVIAMYPDHTADEIVAAMMAKYGDREDVTEADLRQCIDDVASLKESGMIIYQVLMGNVDWKLSVAGGLSGILFLWISKITNEAIGYGDSLAILILGIYLGIWGLLEVLMTAFFILGIIGLICVVIKRKKKGLAFPFYPFLTVGYLLGVCIGGI